MKPKALIKYVEENARQIKKYKSKAKQDDMMNDLDCCVLRPLVLPKSIRVQMTPVEYTQYRQKSWFFSDSSQINKAVKWVKNWVNEKPKTDVVKQ